ncbi:MAG: hypothetical protein Q4C95_08765 [Planctomycetia bacterium]|nr:hypothetical protein [Planctomycetia bacterium]
MSSIKYSELKRRIELEGQEKTLKHISEALQKKDLKPDDFSIRDLAETLITNGRQWIRELDPRSSYGSTLNESLEGVDASAFLNITGQLVYNRILESYHSELFCLSNAVTTITTRLDSEKIPGITGIVDDVAEIHAGMPYPNYGFGEDYIETPPTLKRGLIIPVTKEAVFFDRTHLILSRASEVGEILALNKEKRIADMILGLSNTYVRQGQSFNTYYASSDNGPWVNVVASNSLTSLASVEVAENLLTKMLDPTTLEPVLIEADTILVMPQKKHTASNILKYHNLSYNNGNLKITDNPFYKYNILSSRIAYRQLVNSNSENEAKFADYWYLGNFAKAFAYMENWPVTVSHSAIGSEAEFSQDILFRFKASERGTPAVLNPRYVIKSYNT